jgi:hypothetical protein
MPKNDVETKGWNLAWRKHRQEFMPWLFAVFFYLIFMRTAEPSKFVYGMLGVVLIAPPIIVARMIRTAMESDGP